MRLVLTVLLAGFLAYLSASPAGAVGAQRIELGAKKFEFSQKEIRVRKGQTVTLVLRTEDYAHGFSLPDFNARVDLVPGKVVELTFTADRAGRFEFLCDNFCGEEHDFMAGLLVVED